MKEIKNKFLSKTDTIDNKEDYLVLFKNEEEFKSEEIDLFNEKLNEFILLQKENEEIDLSYICFHEYINILEKNISFTKILVDLEILKLGKNQEDKDVTEINKSFNFANAIFYKRVEFIRTTFETRMNFEGTKFKSDINFDSSIFKDEVIFEGIICSKEAIFQSTTFEKKASFYRARFNDYTSFKDVTFHDKIDFENTVSKDIFFFHNVKLGKISFIGSHLENANFLRLKDKDKKVLQKDNFQNKDSVRLVKAQYEKENNTTEVNWSFPLEQEFYLDLLNKDKPYYPNKNINKISLLVHKYVSNYGTDWVRVLITLFAFGFIASLGYSFADNPVNIDKTMYASYIPIFSNLEKWMLFFNFCMSVGVYILFVHCSKRICKLLIFILPILYLQGIFTNSFYYELSNKVITLINPLNIFNQDMVYIAKDSVLKNINYFENIAIYGVLIKVITISLMYQFVISFRNSTRRK